MRPRFVPRPRFSLRTLLLLTALAAVICAWLTLPKLNAQKFIRLCEQRDYVAADNMLPRDNRFLVQWNELLSKMVESHDSFQIELEDQDSSWIDNLRGRQPIGVSQSAHRWNGSWGMTLSRNARLLYATPFGMTLADSLDQIPNQN